MLYMFRATVFSHLPEHFDCIYSFISNQQDAANFVSLTLLSLLYMFRATVFSHLPEHFDCIYSFISNQQDAANFVFIDSIKFALHVSGDSFVRLEEHFDCKYSFLEQCTDSAVCCRLETQIGWSSCSCSIQSVSPVGSRQQSRYIVPESCIYSRSAPQDGQNCRPKHVEQT